MDKLDLNTILDKAAKSVAYYGFYKLAVSPAFKLLKVFHRYFPRPRRNFKKRYGENAWAVITGATSGIGKQFAF